jgi:hypothetical protein
MNSVEYVKIVEKTAIYPEKLSLDLDYKGLDYAKLGMIGEYGEICNKIKKVYRDNGGLFTPEICETIAPEIGDVYWYIAALCEKEYKISFTAAWIAAERFKSPLDNNFFTILYKGTKYISEICGENVDKEVAHINISYLLSVLNTICKRLYTTPEEVLRYNFEKLSARLINKTLQGSGDNR